MATLEPLSPNYEPTSQTLHPKREYVLSRFAYLHHEQGEVLLESPLAHARIILHDGRAAALVHALAQPRQVRDLVDLNPGLSAKAVHDFVTLLLNAKMLWALNNQGEPPVTETALQSWEFHDLLFHTRSRKGRHPNPVGGTYRFLDRLTPPTTLKPVSSGESFVLYRPDLEQLEREDPPFAWVQEARRSIRTYAEPPLSDQQLGEFLYRVGRVADYRETWVRKPHGSALMAYAPRPYPAGGALYELELYVAINACEGLPSGLYHYDPERHQLNSLSGRTADVKQLLADAAWATQIPEERLQTLIIITSRFQRIAWKYASISYALTLKHVGVLYQTMYLAATAMGLAPCAVGCGNSDLFAQAAGTDYYAETSVGEFLLGSKG